MQVEEALVLRLAAPARLDSKIKSNMYDCAEKNLFVIMVQSLFLPLFPSFLPPAIDLLYGGIYCFVCQDYIYDKDMEQIAKEEQRKAWKLQGTAFRFLPENLMQLMKQGHLISQWRHI